MFALWMAETFLRPLEMAYSKAYSTIRREAVTEMGLSEMPESGRIVPAPCSATHAMSSAAAALPCSNSMPA